MIKTFKKYINLAMVTCVLFLILGIIILVFPNFSMKFFSYSIACTLIIVGAYLLIDKSTSLFASSFFVTGLLSMLLGIVIFIYPESLSVIVPIMVGIWMIINAFYSVRISLILKSIDYSYWVLTILMSILGIICGIIMIINTKLGATVLTTYLGILLIAYSISVFIDLVVFKKNVKDIVKKIE